MTLPVCAWCNAQMHSIAGVTGTMTPEEADRAQRKLAAGEKVFGSMVCPVCFEISIWEMNSGETRRFDGELLERSLKNNPEGVRWVREMRDRMRRAARAERN
ncbi:MAG: hypothetical protein EPO02_08750 [Nitrospirae bacterium]|nr:MAG: hypothetical protein EPO02_08750 [Nitrospirota bacterium]